MSTGEDDLEPKTAPRLSPEDASALWWLGRWIGIPFVIVVALFYMEPLFRSNRVEVVDTVVHQEVHPYPFPPGLKGQTLAPPAIPRAPKPEPVETPELTTAPTITEIVASPLEQPQPTYPQRALEAEKEGTVRLRITIGPDGAVTDATVVNAHPSGWFETSAVAGVRRWRYRASGRTISTEVEIEFKMQ